MYMFACGFRILPQILICSFKYFCILFYFISFYNIDRTLCALWLVLLKIVNVKTEVFVIDINIIIFDPEKKNGVIINYNLHVLAVLNNNHCQFKLATNYMYHNCQLHCQFSLMNLCGRESLCNRHCKARSLSSFC